MPADHPELSSIASLLNELTRRVTAMAESASERKEDDLARELFGTERALSSAERRLQRILNPRR